jgi:hypothetical protein
LTPISPFPAANNPQGRALGGRDNGLPPGSGVPVCPPLFLPGGAVELMKRFAAQMSTRPRRSPFKPDIPGPAGLWHFPENCEEGRGKKTLHHPTAHSPTPCFSDSWCPLEIGRLECQDPCPGGYFSTHRGGERGVWWRRGREDSVGGGCGEKFLPACRRRIRIWPKCRVGGRG